MGFGASALVDLIAWVLTACAVVDVVLIAIAVRLARRTKRPRRLQRALAATGLAVLLGLLLVRIAEALPTTGSTSALWGAGIIVVLIAPGLGALGSAMLQSGVATDAQ